jgi:hypothetical protein
VKGVELTGFERQFDMRVHDQYAGKFIFDLGLAPFFHLALNLKNSKIHLKFGTRR